MAYKVIDYFVQRGLYCCTLKYCLLGTKGVFALPAPKRVLCIMDLAVVGRSSLAVVAPVLAACGVQCCPLPAALFSSHTGGFGAVEKLDAADFGLAALQHYTAQEQTFDAVYTGYLCGDAQFALAEAALRQYPEALRVVDPVLGDGGRLYSGLAAGTVEQMLALCNLASLITPNCTESALLTGLDPADPAANQPDAVAGRLARLAKEGRSVLITSAPLGGGHTGVLGCGPLGADAFEIPVDQQPQNYPGTGDLFTAAVTGLLLRGEGLQPAVRRAAAFVGRAVKATLEGGGEVRQGVWFEPLLPLLREKTA